MGKKICALTMVRNDEFYLRKWVAYYGGQLGRENLYVYKAKVVVVVRKQGYTA